MRNLVVVALLLTARLARAEAADPKLAGTYAYAGGDAERTKLTEAIERVVAKMSAITRGIARGRLQKGNAPTAEVQITLAPASITIARTGKPAVAAPLDGTKVQRNTTAGMQDVTHVVAGGKITQDMHGKNSHSTNVLSLSPDGATLVIHTTIESASLPDRVIYTMTYKRR